MSRRPVTRSLAVVLREMSRAQTARLLVGEVEGAAPDSKHVTVRIGGSLVTLPRLASYTTPVDGEPCYCLAVDNFVIALGSVR